MDEAPLVERFVPQATPQEPIGIGSKPVYLRMESAGAPVSKNEEAGNEVHVNFEATNVITGKDDLLYRVYCKEGKALIR
jgi:hypothetical protein